MCAHVCVRVCGHLLFWFLFLKEKWLLGSDGRMGWEEKKTARTGSQEP